MSAPSPTEYLPFLAEVLPAELCRRQTTLSLAQLSLEPRQLFHNKTISPKITAYSALKIKTHFLLATKDLMTNLDQLLRISRQQIGRNISGALNGATKTPNVISSSPTLMLCCQKCISQDAPGYGTKSFTHWCWAFPLFPPQLGYGNNCGM